MKRAIRWAVILGILGAIGWAINGPLAAYFKERNRVQYREAEASSGDVVAVVNSTGTVKPVQSVSIGSVVSGPIEAIYVDFNAEVKKDQLLAKVDPRIYKANEARDKAQLATRRAEIQRVKADLQKAINDETRSLALQAENKNFISMAEIDQFKFNRMSLDAQLVVAQTLVEQAQANLDMSVANVAYTEIRSPVDGVVIDRKIDEGQTMAAQFQTPELFILAPNMRQEMRVFASVDEADIGMIRDAQLAGQPVHFTVDAYPDELFAGKIFQIRRNSATVQNVVTYPVIVSAPNPDLKLLPGMTASISFQVGAVKKVMRVPNAALRFYPQREHVRPEDRPLLENLAPAVKAEDDDSQKQPETTRSAQEKAKLRRERNRRHVWTADTEGLRAIEIITGLSDSSFTQVVSGELREGQMLVTGVLKKQ